MLYQLTLRDDRNLLHPVMRTVSRDDLVAAVDSAMRWLRLTRNINYPGQANYTRWEVAIRDDGGQWVSTVFGDIHRPFTE